MARDDDLMIVKAAMSFHLALVSNPQLTDESWNKSKTACLDLINDIVNIAHPWAAKSTEQRKMEEYDTLSRMYKERIGDLDDPVFYAALMEEVHRMRNDNEVEVEESDEARIDRLYSERILARK